MRTKYLPAILALCVTLGFTLSTPLPAHAGLLDKLKKSLHEKADEKADALKEKADEKAESAKDSVVPSDQKIDNTVDRASDAIVDSATAVVKGEASQETSSARSSQPKATHHTSSGAAAAPVNVDSPALKALYRKLDIGGVQLGMTPQAAQAALQRRNPALVKEQVQPFAFTDLPNTEFTSRVNFKGPMARQTEDENISLGLTLQPMQPEVLSIFRGTQYVIDHQPTAKNTVAALQAKYGPVSLLEDTPSANEIFILWIFDGEGNLVSKARAEKIRSCGVNFREPSSGYIGRDSLLPHWDINCEPYTILKAILKTNFANTLDSRGQSLPTGLLTGLQVVATSNPLFTKTVITTRRMILAAKAANVKKNEKAADKNVPIL